MNKEYRTGRHCLFILHVHLVFVAKYRRNIFKNEHYLAMRHIFGKVCQDFDAQLKEVDGESDHVHLLIEYPTKVAISKLVNSLKGVSSRMLRKQFPELEKSYFKGVLWTPSYFASSCGGAPIEIIKKYIEEQNRVE